MRRGHWVGPLLACGFVSAFAAVPAQTDGPPAAVSARQKSLERQFRASLDWYTVFASPDATTPLPPLSVLRWTNAPRGQEGEPTLLLWAEAGRPVALSSVYPWAGSLVYDCVSLSRGPGLTVKESGRTVWSPTTPGVTFKAIPDAPAPAANPAARLSQMKLLADRFKVTMTGLKVDLSDREEMRLLPKPIYRYAPAAGQTAPADLIDGAVFAFVQGTDPEAVLLLEAVRSEGRPAWQFAFGRATSAGLIARLGNAVVWTAAREFGSYDPKSPTIVLGRPLEP